MAAGSVVPPKLVIPPGVLVRGSPAKVVRELSADERAWARDAVSRYVALAREHKGEQLALGIRLP